MIPGISAAIKQSDKRKFLAYILFQALLLSALFFVSLFLPPPPESTDRFLLAHHAPEVIPKLRITITEADLKKLTEIRNRVIERGFSVAEGVDEPAMGLVEYDSQQIPAKIRLGGSNIDHFQGVKWTLNVKLRGQHSLFGKNSFGLLSPPTRGYFYERLLDDHLAIEDVMHEVYDYADVTLNGQHIGIMLVEKPPDDELQRREGGTVAKGILPGKASVAYRHSNHTYHMHWRGYSAYAKNKKEEDLAAFARSMIRALQLGTLPASDIFDAEVMGRYMAIAELWGSWHAVEWGDMRFYLNPHTLKLEPIGQEAGVELREGKNGGPTMQAFMHFGTSPADTLFADDKIRAAFVRNLQRITQDEYIDRITKQLLEKEAAYRKILSVEYKDLPPSPTQAFKKRAEILKSINESNVLNGPHLTPHDLDWSGWDKYNPTPRIYPKPKYYPIRALVHKIVDDGDPYLEFNNSLPWWIPDAPNLKRELLVTKVTIKTDKGEEPLDGVTYPFLLQNGKPVYVHSKLIAGMTDDDVSGTIYGSMDTQPEDRYAFTTYDMELPLKKHPLTRPSMDEVLAAHPFLEKQGENLVVKPGIWQVTRPLILPDNVALEAGEGTKLEFAKDSYLSASGPLIFKGSADRPVILSGQNGNIWKGIAVIRAAKESLLQHTVISNTTFTHVGVWRPTGGTTFYESDVHIVDSDLNGSSAEDMINIVRSKFLIENSHFRNSHSDALDSDFSVGTIRHCLFENIGTDYIGGDAVDVSGTTVEVLDTKFRTIKDKGISAGEASTVHASGMDLDNAGIGIASKDDSVVHVEHSHFSHAVHAALIAYRKKRFYDGGTMIASDVDLNNNITPVLVQSDSRIVLDGRVMPTESREVIDKMFWKVYRYNRYVK